MVAKRMKKAKAKTKPKGRPPLAKQPYEYEEGTTQSLICDWLECRQRARYVLDGWTMPQPKEAMEYGSLFHFLLEHLYKLVITGVVTGYKDAIAAFESLLTQYVKQYEARRNESSLTPQKMEVLAAQAEGVWPQYCRHWHKDFTKTKWLELEGVFDVRWGTHRLRGMRDGVFERKDGLWWLETKTKGKWSQDTLERTLCFNFQNLFYILAGEVTAQDIGSKKKIAGVLYNIVRRPQIQPGKDGDLKAYVKRLQEDTKTRPNFYYNRMELTYSEKVRAAFRREIEDALGEFRLWLKGERPTYRNRTACEGRKWNCQFIDACAKGHMRNYRQTGRLFVELEG